MVALVDTFVKGHATRATLKAVDYSIESDQRPKEEKNIEKEDFTLYSRHEPISRSLGIRLTRPIDSRST
jgi:hypothetical protein